VIASPIFALLFIAYALEGLLIRDNRGPPFVYYRAISAGKEFPKYKFRTIKTSCVDQELAKHGDWHAYAGEWTPESLTYVGRFVKKTYLDELPQLWNILSGAMSLVGPRPLAVHHYERDLAQGNVSRKLLKGGLVGQGQALKGTADLGDPAAEYDYIEKYLNLSELGLLWHDLKIMGRSLMVVFQAKGL
jgi:lipopolysaccharide/colanic/teichoic acid biosynthesis glycosyltransferase